MNGADIVILECKLVLSCFLVGNEQGSILFESVYVYFYTKVQ